MQSLLAIRTSSISQKVLLWLRYKGFVFYKFYSHVHKNSRYTPIYFFKDDQTFYIIDQLRFLLYFFLMGDEKTRLVLTIEEKLSIFNYKESHPEKSFATIAMNYISEWSSKRQKTEATCNNWFFVKEHINKK